VAQSVIRVVFDTNTLLHGMANSASAAAKVLRAAERRVVIPILSKPVIDEYRAVLNDEILVGRFPGIKPETVEMVIERLRYVGDYVRTPQVDFEYKRDPRDQKFLELAIALRATHILSFDQDLLSLPSGRNDASRRYRQRLPQTQILKAADFLEINVKALRL
jgi:putative PIN family toxin of toxin-antitoxin system